MKKILKNKGLICLLAFTFVVFVYCGFQTFIINDDLPYSFYYRGEQRIVDLKQVILNQIQDYSNISPRIFVHSIVQFLLIFGKNLWIILNPIMIIVTVVLMAYIVKMLLDNKENKFFWITVASICTYLLLYSHKYLIYWVAGSVNYVWLFVLILLFIIYVLKNNLLKHPIISSVICFIISLLHECGAIFVLCFLIISMIINFFVNRKQFKNEFWKYLIFLFVSIIGFGFLLLAPSTMNRVVDGEFGQLSLFSKLLISIPVISDNLFNVINIYNLYPIILIVSLGFVIFKQYNKYLYRYLCVTSVIIILAISFDNSWFWFLLGLLLLIVQILILIKNKQYLFIAVLIGAYAIAYSLAITAEYPYGRTNYHFFLIFSILIIYNFANCLNTSKYFYKLLLLTIFFLLIGFEICIYHYIGTIKNDRELHIANAKENDFKIIEIKEIKYPYSRFHIDPNSPASNDYWAYKHFLHYYDLDDDVDVKLVK